MNVRMFHEFFAAASAVLGALIGLLFVAISVSRDRIADEDGSQSHRIRASAALTIFTDALLVALFALIPGVDLAWPALLAAATGEIFVVAALLNLIRLRSHARQYRETFFLVAFATLFAVQLITAIKLTRHPNDVDDVRTLAILVVVCALGGVARSWELIGGPEIGLRREIVAAVREGRPGSGPPSA